MDGEADDFVIDEDGDLVPVYEEECECWSCTPMEQVRAVAMITQTPTGELTIQMFGSPTLQLVSVLCSTMREMSCAMTRH